MQIKKIIRAEFFVDDHGRGYAVIAEEGRVFISRDPGTMEPDQARVYAECFFRAAAYAEENPVDQSSSASA